MKTATITEVNSIKEYQGKNGLTLYHNLTMNNGDKINIGKKVKQLVGGSLHYEITDSLDTHEFKKAKPVSPNNFTYSNKDDFKPQICFQSARRDFAILNQGKNLTPEQLHEGAMKVYELHKNNKNNL